MESESLSSNVKWGFRKQFQDGVVYSHYATLLGYREGEDGQPEIDEEQAVVVRRIFANYLTGQSFQNTMCMNTTRLLSTVKLSSGYRRSLPGVPACAKLPAESSRSWGNIAGCMPSVNCWSAVSAAVPTAGCCGCQMANDDMYGGASTAWSTVSASANSPIAGGG